MEWTSFDSWIVVTGMLSAMACALLGNYLVLRRMSMMGDAISHAVLPGLAIAFIVTGSRGSLPMLVGATLIGIVTAFLIQVVIRLSGPGSELRPLRGHRTDPAGHLRLGRFRNSPGGRDQRGHAVF